MYKISIRCQVRLYLVVMLCLPIELIAQEATQRYRIGVCDWMMLKRQKLGAFPLAREVGADGIEMDMGPLGQRELFDNQLRDSLQCAKFLEASKDNNIMVPSVAMSGFFAQNLLARDNYMALAVDCFNTMKLFGSRVAFLPLGGSGNEWIAPGADHDKMVTRLREIGNQAHQNGLTVGIRTGQDARYDKRLLKEIGSKGIRIYFNLQDAVDNHRDPCEEIRILGRKRICQIHASLTDSVTLNVDPRIDLPRLRRTLHKMHWSGWLVVERSRDASRVRDVKYNFSTNVMYLKEIFEGD